MEQSDQRRNADHEGPDQYASGDQRADDPPGGHQSAAPESAAPEPAAPDSADAGFGDPRVDAAVARTDGLDERPIEEHGDVFDDVHRSFRETLDDPEADRSGA